MVVWAFFGGSPFNTIENLMKLDLNINHPPLLRPLPDRPPQLKKHAYPKGAIYIVHTLPLALVAARLGWVF